MNFSFPNYTKLVPVILMASFFYFSCQQREQEGHKLSYSLDNTFNSSMKLKCDTVIDDDSIYDFIENLNLPKYIKENHILVSNKYDNQKKDSLFHIKKGIEEIIFLHAYEKDILLQYTKKKSRKNSCKIFYNIEQTMMLYLDSTGIYYNIIELE